MECTWFLCLGGRFGAGTIAVLGIVHPLLYWRAARRFRSELFLAMYLLVAVWSALSLLMLIGVMTDTAWLLTLWQGYSLVFVVLMVILLIFVTVGFCVLDMKNSAIIPILGILYYILTVYFICVVETHKRDLLGKRVLRHEHVENSTEWLGRQGGERRTRGRCVVPRRPAAGAYEVAAARGGGRGRRYTALRLRLLCREGHVPRHRDYVDCYNGGWNLPLPQCVPVEEIFETITEEYEEAEAEAGVVGRCVARRPPDHGYYVKPPSHFEPTNYLSLVVACASMHYMVGWARVTCRDGVWDRPQPKCLFVDTDVCTLPRKPHMRHTCLGGEQYAGTYPCDAGLVPHGAVVEPACLEHYYVWGSFTYMHCVDGLWVPAASRNLFCLSKVDIYRQYEIEERIAMTASTPVQEEEEEEPSTKPTKAKNKKGAGARGSDPSGAASSGADPSGAASSGADPSGAASSGADPSDTLRANLTKANVRISRSESGSPLATTADTRLTWNERAQPSCTRNKITNSPNNRFTKYNIWKSHSENDIWINDNSTRTSESTELPSANLTNIGIWKPSGGVAGPRGGSSTTGTNIWKSRNDTCGTKSAKTNIWKSEASKQTSTNSINITNTSISQSEAEATSSRINIWKGGGEATEPVYSESTGARAWRPHPHPRPRPRARHKPATATAMATGGTSTRTNIWESRDEADRVNHNVD